ncbi:potassium-tellurite ethidium and proflavin transporter [Actinoplanes sp. N902-109]|uniref:SLAC1 family transporter n=1 Tax=Actinoplanes sp. (strain N902-109) TaxID=649831 RepID=UPI00032964E7|nr:potassium-tellurite ethidium and proflavin transporter [Actinoplanes sp. N902-109]AGL18799.1 potassium-tellurite ethidium and proflavin transporter [Actinoplanes sp. N902-109]
MNGLRGRVTPNLFGVSFGFAGLAACWNQQVTVVADALWIVAGLVWLATIVAYGSQRPRDHHDPTFAPFLSLIAIVPMMMAVPLAAHVRVAGVALYLAGLIGTVLFGGWLSARWIVEDIPYARWHPGYFLPTVAGGLIAAQSAALLGYAPLAYLMLGFGVVCWLVLGSILLLRLFTQPTLAPGLLPTMAIEVAPPVVAGNAWFAINGRHADVVALMLAGYAMLMVLLQAGLVPLYRKAPFGPGWWAFSFAYAAVFADALQWLRAEDVPARAAWSYVLLTVISGWVLYLCVRTVLAMTRHTFLPPRT